MSEVPPDVPKKRSIDEGIAWKDDQGRMWVPFEVFDRVRRERDRAEHDLLLVEATARALDLDPQEVMCAVRKAYDELGSVSPEAVSA